MAASKIAGLFVSLDLNFAKFTEGLNKARAATDTQTALISKSLGAVRTAFAGLGVGIGALGVVQGMRSVVNASLDFESSFVGIRKTVKATEPELQAISRAFIQMSKTMPVSTTELNNIGAAAGQLGIETNNIAKFSKVMAQLGVTTNLASTEAATALARFANITQMPEENFDRLGSVVVALGNTMKTTEREIVEMSLRLAASGKIVGLTEGQILAFAASLSAVGVEAEAGGSAFSKLFIEISQAVANSSKELDVFAKAAGMSAKDFKESFQKDASGAILSFVEGLGKIKAAGGNVFTTLEDLGITEVRMRNAVLALAVAGDTLRSGLDIQGDAWEKNNALTKEYGTFAATAANQLVILNNQLAAMKKTIGDELVPKLLALVNGLKSTVETAVQMKDSLTLAFGAVLVQQIVTSTVAIRAFGNALVAVQILSTVRSLEGLRIALGAIVPAAGAALAALNTLVVPAAIASFAVLVTEMYKTGKAEQELHDNTVQLSKMTVKMSEELKSKYGVEISRAGKSTNEWNREVTNALALHSGLTERLENASDLLDGYALASDKAAEAAGGVSKEVLRLQKILGIPIEFGPVKVTKQLNDILDGIFPIQVEPIKVPISIELDTSTEFFELQATFRQQRIDEVTARLDAMQATHDFANSISGVMDTEFQKELFEGAAEAAKLVAPEVKKATEATNDYAHAITSGLEAAMQKWEGFGKLVVGVLNDIAATILRNKVTGPLTDWLSTALKFVASALPGGAALAAPAFSGLGSASFGEFLSGFRAHGGPVSAGGRFMVGERGPEIFTPQTAGTIIPNDAIGGGQTTVIQYNIDARGAGPGVEAEIRRALRDVEDRAVMRSVRTVHDLKLRTA